ncbi:hypothetical protein ElyMa_005556200 [Elysia marginata]|uniref:Uncharacterized protein n=1 Tax=Elysia marginata TaxID=1093978 RepID=A0AAV4EZ97_9GAST|nr:hypothetical protein ElyMa_005556200 [Elysia marginata]
MPRGRVAPALEKTPSKTKLFTIDMPGGRPDSAVSTMGINPSINSANMASPSNDKTSEDSASVSSRGNFSTTIPIFRGPNSGHPPRSVAPGTKERKSSETEDGPEPEEETAVPHISVKNPGAGSFEDTRPHVKSESDLAMEGDPNHLSPLIKDPSQENRPPSIEPALKPNAFSMVCQGIDL